MAILCDRCEGTGREMRGYDDWVCDVCDGKGFIPETDALLERLLCEPCGRCGDATCFGGCEIGADD